MAERKRKQDRNFEGRFGVNRSRGRDKNKFVKDASRPIGNDRRHDRYDDRAGDGDLIFGRNPVIEALENGKKLDKVLLLDGTTGSISKIFAMAKDANVKVEFVDRKVLDRISGGENHQGVIAKAQTFEYSQIRDIIELAQKRGEEPFVLILDGIEDPHNLGAIMRTAECSGAHGIVIAERRASGVTPVAVKVAAGAAEHVLVARVTNTARAIDELKDLGLWITGLDMGKTHYYQQNLTGPIGIVVGNEGKGLSRLVKEKCDFITSIPLKGKVTSLNASNAACVVAYEVVRQRDNQ